MDASQQEPVVPADFLWADFHANVAPEQQTNHEALPLRIIVPSHGKTRREVAYLENIFGPKSCNLQIISLIKDHSKFVAKQNPNRDAVGAVTAQTAMQQSQ